MLLLRAWVEDDLAGLAATLDQWADHSVDGIGEHQAAEVLPTDKRDRYDWLLRHGLVPIFADMLHKRIRTAPGPGIDDRTREVWRNRRLACISRSLRLESVAGKMTKALDAWGRPWATIKGFSLARQVYDQPAIRLTGDIDILVAPEHLREALEVLCAIGGRKEPPRKRSHEECVYLSGIFIDLHRAPVRIGRMRFNPSGEWLSRTQRAENYPCLSEHDELVLSFFHPAVTDYLTARTVRLLDIVLQMRRHRETTDWQRLAADVSRLGLANAAYATAIYVNHLFPSKNGPLVPRHFIDSLKVDRFRRRYWRFWLDRQPDRLFADKPLIAQALFNLWLNDAPLDWARAIIDRRLTFR